MRVALEVPLPRLFDYSLPAGAAAVTGDRVTVPLGRRNQMGVVIEADIESELDTERLKPIVDVRSDDHAVPPGHPRTLGPIDGCRRVPGR